MAAAILEFRMEGRKEEKIEQEEVADIDRTESKRERGKKSKIRRQEGT